MRVLVSGHHGYIGSILVPLFGAAGHEVVGLDTYMYEGCDFDEERAPTVPAIRKDVRDVTPVDLDGFDAVIHLAALSNDPVGDLNPDCTFAINHRASVSLARAAKQAGVGRFLFASSCSLYGAAGKDWIDETAEFNPVTPMASRRCSPSATSACSPTIRSARPSCATQPPTASLRATGAISSSTTSRPSPSPPAKC